VRNKSCLVASVLVIVQKSKIVERADSGTHTASAS